MNKGAIGSNFLKLIILTGDILIMNFGVYFTFLILFDFSPEQRNLDPYFISIPFISVSTILFFQIYGLYRILKNSLLEVIYSIGLSVVFIALVTTAITFFLRGFAFPRSVILVSPFVQFALLSMWRALIWKLNRIKHGIKNIVIIGNDSEVREIAEKIHFSSKEIYNILYINYAISQENTTEMLGDADEVFICPSLDDKNKTEIISKCITGNKNVYLVPNLYEILLAKSTVSQFDDTPVFSVAPLGLTMEQRFAKRMFDFLAAFIGLAVLLPLMAVVAAAIKLDSKGPVFYVQERVTRNNGVFRLIKFRTMKADAEKLTGPVLASREDSRVTRVGKFIRTTRLDELPQLINVLKGDMSFVGPRPERQFFIEQFEKEIPNYNFRHSVKAGITGVAQVRGKYTTSAADKLKYDLMYIRNYSFFLDLKIIFQTVKILFMKESSSGVDKNKEFDELLEKETKEVYSEISVTRMEKK